MPDGAGALYSTTATPYARTLLSGRPGLGQSEGAQIIGLLPHSVQLAVEIEILQDTQYDCLADPARTDGIQHPQNPPNELPRALLQLDFVVQDNPVLIAI